MAELVEVLEIDLTDVQTEAEETGKTLRDLRNEVKELRSTLEGTEIGTEEFGKTLTELTIKQQELTNVTKSGVAAQKGSYNDLVNQMALLKTEWRATADEAKRTALGEQIASINSQLKELDATVGNHQREVGNYKLALKNLKEELLSLEEGTEEYNQKLAQAAEIAQRMQDVNEFVAASAQDLGDHLSNVTGVAAGMVGMFQTVQASLNLIGVESESVGKMLVTMQNLMAITQGLTTIEGAIDKYKRLNNTIKGLTIVQNLFNTSKKASATATSADAAASTADAAAKGAQATATSTATAAQWSLNAAIAANPLGALLMAITAVVTAVVSLVSWYSEATDVSEDLADANDRLTDSLAEQNREIDYNIRMMEAQGKTRKEALQSSLKDYKKQYEDAYNTYLDMYKKAAAHGGGLFGSPISDDEQAELDKAYKTYTDQVEKYNDVIRDIKIESAREATEATRRADEERTRNAQKAAQKRLETAKQEAEKAKTLREKYTIELNRTLNAVYEFGLDEHSKQRKDIIDDINARLREQKAAYEQGAISYKEMSEYYVALRMELNGKLQELELKHARSEVQLVKESLNDQIVEYKRNRDRIIRMVVATEESAKKAYENLPIGSTAKAKVEAEEAMLATLKKTYTEQLALLQAQDTKEREAIQAQITILEERENTMGLLKEEKELLTELKDQLSMVGAESIGVTAKLNEVNVEMSKIGTEKVVVNLEYVRDSFQQLKDVWTDLNDISDAFSAEWGEFFDSIINGVDLAITSLREMNSVVKSNASETEKAAAKWKGYGQMAAAGLTVAANLMGALADEQDKTTEEGFERSKKFQIAQAVMSTLAGIASAWASSMQLGPIAGPIMGAILSAMMATMGGIQIANIKKQKFDGGGSENVSGSSTPTLSALQMMDTGVQATTSIEGASYESQVTDTKVYVVESDITKTQNDVRTAVGEATY